MLFERDYVDNNGNESWRNTGSNNNEPDCKMYDSSGNVVATNYGDKWYDEHGDRIYR